MVDGIETKYSFTPILNVFSLSQIKNARFTERDLDRYLQIYLKSQCAYVGESEFDGRKLRFMLNDTDCNGRFTDLFTFRNLGSPGKRSPLHTTGDKVYITEVDDNFSYYSLQILGDQLVIGSNVYIIDIDIPAKKIILTEITENLVPMDISMDVDRLTIYSEDRKHCLNMYRPGTNVMVPADTYRLLFYQVFRADDMGDLWRLSANGSTESPFVKVDSSGKSIMPLGEPFYAGYRYSRI